MTDSPTDNRNTNISRWVRRFLVVAVLLVAFALRLHGVDFGLPALNDPDEPLFMMTAFEMLAKGSFNPEWFGHPATTTLYGLALVMLGVAVVGIGSGRFADVEAFGKAAYLDPGLVWLPAREFIAVCGVICVLLVYRIGKRLAKENGGGERMGLVAALFLAVNAVHIEYSQIIRTDVMATVFMLLATLSALAILREGRLRDYVLAGVFVGVACATKWPAALVGASAICAGFYRLRQGHREWSRLAALAIAAPVTLFVVSPYLLLDYQTVVYNLSHEARSFHPGSTGGGFLPNLVWYVTDPLLTSLGWAGLAIALVGMVWPLRRDWAVAVLPGALIYLVSICAQALIWERWIVPLLPFAALAAARALFALGGLIRARFDRPLPWIEAVAALALIVPMLDAARISVTERTHDTRQAAGAWARAHIPAGRTILIEHAGFDLMQGGWQFRFPLGSAGCVDARAMLSGSIRYSEVEQRRTGSPIVDLGYVDPKLLPTCRADYAIVTHYDRYLAEPAHFGAEIESYRRVLAGGRERAVFRPVPGASSGPIVRIVELAPPR